MPTMQKNIDKDKKILVDTLYGMKSAPKTKKFKNMKAYEKWADSEDAENYTIQRVYNESLALSPSGVHLTESRLRQIIREEASRLLREAGPLTPTPGMSPRGPADTFLIYTGGTDPDFGGPSGMVEYYIGTREDVEAFAAGEPVKLKPAPSIGTQRQWDRHMNGGPNPIAMWLKKHPEIKYILDQDHPDPFGSTEFFDTAEWIAWQEDSEFHG